MGEWEFSEQISTNKLPEDNKILGYILQRLKELVYPVVPGSPKPVLPVFPLKAIVLGKPFAGKTSALKTVGQSNINFIFI